MADQIVTGLNALLKNIGRINAATIRKVSTIVEKRAVRVRNHAKADHFKGLAHAVGRYENQTSNLTNSITSKLTRADATAVEAIVFTNKEYAPKLEFGEGNRKPYPFMRPAMEANLDGFRADMKALRVGDA